MNKGINIFHGERDLKDTQPQAEIKTSNGSTMWVNARPLGYQSFRHRLRCAWLVFQEKADILVWDYQ